MLLDYPSLLVAIGFSAICLSVILFASWMASRADGFLLTSAAAAAMVVGSVFTYSIYVESPSLTLVVVAFAFLLMGMSILFGAARQFRLGTSPARRIVAAAISLPICLSPFFLGYDGPGFILVNLATAGLLLLAAWEYWKGRSEALVPIASLCGLYVLVAVSFVFCALMLIADGKLVLDGPPQNWAETFNAVVVIAGVAGNGALSLALNQTRLAQSHRRDAMIDPLSGLLNRRALFDAIQIQPLQGETAIVVFDIDRFKAINDERGHGTGDRAISLFADVMRHRLMEDEIAARLGGEEFALVLRGVNAEHAVRRAEQVRADFARAAKAELELSATASAGIAFGQPNGWNFEAMLNVADQMLYEAKRAGRDGVVVAAPRLVADNTLRPPPSSHP